MDGKVFLKDIAPSTPCARIHNWPSRIRGAWLIEVDDTIVSTVDEVAAALAAVTSSETSLLFAHSEIRHGLSNAGIPLVNMDQLNNRHQLKDYDYVPEGLTPDTLFNSPVAARVSWVCVDGGGVLNSMTRANRLTRSKLLRQEDWNDWQASKYLQLDQYMKQFMFGKPTAVESKSAVFNLI